VDGVGVVRPKPELGPTSTRVRQTSCTRYAFRKHHIPFHVLLSSQLAAFLNCATQMDASIKVRQFIYGYREVASSCSAPGNGQNGQNGQTVSCLQVINASTSSKQSNSLVPCLIPCQRRSVLQFLYSHHLVLVFISKVKTNSATCVLLRPCHWMQQMSTSTPTTLHSASSAIQTLHSYYLSHGAM
jgi:hypothetical protein